MLLGRIAPLWSTRCTPRRVLVLAGGYHAGSEMQLLVDVWWFWEWVLNLAFAEVVVDWR
jgi:hypothetical protein